MNFGEEIEQLRNEQPIKIGNAVEKLNSFMDSDGILRVGRRLNQAPIDVAERSPIIIQVNITSHSWSFVTTMNSRNTKDAITQKEQSEQRGFG